MRPIWERYFFRWGLQGNKHGVCKNNQPSSQIAVKITYLGETPATQVDWAELTLLMISSRIRGAEVSRALAEEARRAASKNFMIIVSVLEEFSGFLNWVLLLAFNQSQSSPDPPCPVIKSIVIANES